MKILTWPRLAHCSKMLACAATAIVFLLSAGTVAQDETAGAADDFRSLLLDSGLSAEDLAKFDAPNQAKLTTDQLQVLSRILYRLDQVDAARLATPGESITEGGDLKAGHLILVEGAVESVEPVALPVPQDAAPDFDALYLCRVAQRSGPNLILYSPTIPKAWQRTIVRDQFNEPVKFVGVVLQPARNAEGRQILAVTNRLQWRPKANAPAGALWLANRGYDVALLDDVRQGTRFANPSESREAEAFYQALARLADAEASALLAAARAAVARSAQAWADRSVEAGQKLIQLREAAEQATPSELPAMQRELAQLRRVQSIAQHVAERAEHGDSSVWPLYFNAEESVGEFVLIEGVARRAVRILMDEPVEGLTHYYELEVFPPDAQNQPVVCCVARLPDGFPMGDVIREHVRVAGIFFKRWAYARRPAAPSGKNAIPAQLAPPLMLAADAEWLSPPPVATINRGGLWAGLALLGAVAVIGVILARIARRDRLARSQRARYDASLDDLANL